MSAMNSRGSQNLIHSFGCAFRGIFCALARERNMRIHTAAALLLLYFSRYYQFDAIRYALLFLAMGMVIVAELLNTAIEKAVDLESPSFHKLARLSKDVAAGAVLVASICSAGVGFALFWDMPVISRIAQNLLAHPVASSLGLLAVLAAVFLPSLNAGKREPPDIGSQKETERAN